MKKYEVSIYGKTNSIYRSIQDKCLMSEEVMANSVREAKEIVWNKFEKDFLTRNDVRIECERF